MGLKFTKKGTSPVQDYKLFYSSIHISIHVRYLFFILTFLHSYARPKANRQFCMEWQTKLVYWYSELKILWCQILSDFGRICCHFGLV